MSQEHDPVSFVVLSHDQDGQVTESREMSTDRNSEWDLVNHETTNGMNTSATGTSSLESTPVQKPSPAPVEAIPEVGAGEEPSPAASEEPAVAAAPPPPESSPVVSSTSSPAVRSSGASPNPVETMERTESTESAKSEHRRKIEAAAEAERKEFEAKLAAEKAERQRQQELEESREKEESHRAFLIQCQKARDEMMRSEMEKRRDIILNDDTDRRSLGRQEREGRAAALQDEKERLEVEALARAADDASRQRLVDAEQDAIKQMLEEEQAAAAAAAAAQSAQETANSNRRCDCLGASSGVHRPSCPLKA